MHYQCPGYLKSCISWFGRYINFTVALTFLAVVLLSVFSRAHSGQALVYREILGKKIKEVY